MDKSNILGRVDEDKFTIAGLAQPIKTAFGCILEQNEIMRAPGVDGIWGVGKASDNHNGDTL